MSKLIEYFIEMLDYEENKTFKETVTLNENNHCGISFDLQDLINESIEHDNYILNFAKFITNKIRRLIRRSLTKDSRIKLKNCSNDILQHEFIDHLSNFKFNPLYKTHSCELLHADKDKKIKRLFIVFAPRYPNDKENAKFQKITNDIGTISFNICDLDGKINLLLLRLLLTRDISIIEHELIHCFDMLLTDINKSKLPSNKNQMTAYYRDPREFHAYSLQILSELDKYCNRNGFDNNIQQLMNNRNMNEFFDNLKTTLNRKIEMLDYVTTNQKKNLFSRLLNYLSFKFNKTISESTIEKDNSYDNNTIYILLKSLIDNFEVIK